MPRAPFQHGAADFLGELDVRLASGTHDDEPVDDRPEVQPAECQQLADAEADVSEVEAIDSELSQEQAENEGERGVLPARCELNVELRLLRVRHILLQNV